MSLAKRLLKNSTLKDTDVYSGSKFIMDMDEISLPVPMMNVAFSGRLDGGFKSGLTLFAGPSRHFKSLFCLVEVKAYLDKYDDGICLFYDSEFGTMPEYFENFGIDPSRIIHTPIENIEEMKFDIANQLSQIEREDKVIIFVDSIGNLASKKELNDALEQKAKADMTRAKEIKSMFRIVTPMLTKRDVPMIVVAHTYNTMEMYSKPVVSGGTGIFYSSTNIFIVGRRQVKDGKDLEGYEFILNTEKSRYIKEKSAIPITVKYGTGIDVYSGLLDIAVATGFVISPKIGWYSRPSIEDDKNWRKKAVNCSEFWNPLLANGNFNKAVEEMFSLKGSKLFSEEQIETVDEETGEVVSKAK